MMHEQFPSAAERSAERDTALSSEHAPLTPEASWSRMRQMADDLQASSSYQRSAGRGRETIASPEGEAFTIQKLTKPYEKAAKRTHEFMVEQFGKEESETLNWFRHTIKNGINDYHTMEHGGEVVAFSNTRLLELEPQEGKAPEAVLTVWHISTEEEMRNKGLASELYQSFYRDAAKKAEERGQTIVGVMGEAVDTVESFLNRMGRKRAYYEDADGNIRELPYQCPPVDMDSKTGEPLEKPVPEHVMLRMTDDRQEMPAEDVLRMVEAIYFREYLGTEDDYDSPEVYRAARQSNANLLEGMRTALAGAKDGKVFLMSRDERGARREALRAQGKDVYDIVTGTGEATEG